MSNIKLRYYELTIQLEDKALLIKPPFSISFSGTKSIKASLNKLNLNIFNLSEEHREKLIKSEREQKRIPVILSIGYEDDHQVFFKGTLHKGEIKREGPNIVNTLECLDGGFDYLNGYVSSTVTSRDQAIDEILGSMPSLTKGSITEQKTLVRPKVLVGSPMEVMSSMVEPGENYFIDEEQLHYLKADEVRPGEIPVVKPSTGLLTTPSTSEGKVNFQTILNPLIKIGGRVQLESTLNKKLNGVYKVETINYNGDYSGDAWDEKVITFPQGTFKEI